MVAIVTDVHYRMSLALIRDLAQAGVEVITCEQDRCRDSRTSPALGALSRYVSRHVWLPGGTDGLEALLSLCRETGLGRDCRPALLPAGAATLALIAENRERFEPLCGLCVPTAEQLDLLNSKPRLAALAARLGVPLPESMAPGEDLDRFLDRQGLPCVIKPACGEKLGLTAAARYAVASTREEALAILREGRVELTVMGLGAPVKAVEKSARISLKLPPKLNEASDSLCQSLLTGLLVYLQAMGEEYPENLTILLDDDDEKE